MSAARNAVILFLAIALAMALYQVTIDTLQNRILGGVLLTLLALGIYLVFRR